MVEMCEFVRPGAARRGVRALPSSAQATWAMRPEVRGYYPVAGINQPPAQDMPNSQAGNNSFAPALDRHSMLYNGKH